MVRFSIREVGDIITSWDSSVSISTELKAARSVRDSWLRQEIFLFYIKSRPTPRPTQAPVQRAPELCSGGQATGVQGDHPSLQVMSRLGTVELFLYSPISPHGMVLNYTI